MKLRPNAELTQLQCPLCREGEAEGKLVPCPGCATPRHEACAAEFGCGTLGCSRKRPRSFQSTAGLGPAPAPVPAAPAGTITARARREDVFDTEAWRVVEPERGPLAAPLGRDTNLAGGGLPQGQQFRWFGATPLPGGPPVVGDWQGNIPREPVNDFQAPVGPGAMDAHNEQF